MRMLNRSVAAALAASVSLALSFVAKGADYFVPDNFATIQTAINASSSGDTITVRQGIYNERIDIGGRNIVLKGELGAAATIIDPQGAGGVVVQSSNAAANGWRLEGFTIRNGLDSGVYISGVTATVKNCKFLNNQASRGGGAHVRAGANVTFEGCEFTQNKANTGERRGGALFVESATVRLDSGSFTGNEARLAPGGYSGEWYQRGGAIAGQAAAITVENCVSNQNRAIMEWINSGCQNGVTFFCFGGFAAVDGGSLLIRGHQSVDDQAFVRIIDQAGYCNDRTSTGDARAGFAFASNATVVVEDCSIVGARAESIGQGGCCYYNDVYPRGVGGAFFLSGGSATIARCTVDSASVIRTWLGGSGGPQESNAGFLYHEAGVLTLTDTTVRNSTAPDFGGAIRTVTGAGLTISGCRFENCVSGKTGGAISASVAATFNFTETEFVGCRTDAASGGAIWLTGGTRNFTDCTFTNNTAQGGGDHRGGAVYAEGGAQMNFTDCDFAENRALSSGDNADRTTWGGACAMFGVTPRYTRCNFTNNAAISTGNGGGWRRAHGGATAEYDSDAVFTDCVFANNRAECVGNGARYSRGGTVHLWNSDSDFLRTSMTGGRALPLDIEARGGAVWMENVSRPGFTYCTITDCQANEGAGLYITASEPYLVSTALRRNAASSQGGGLLVDGSSTPYVLGCAFEQNAAPSGGAIRTLGSGTNVPFVVNSTFCGNTVDTISGSILGGEGNVTTAVCSTDCNNNGTPDADDIAAGAADIDGNGVLDSCQTDCNANGLPDAYELGQNAVSDCNGNGTPDACDIASGVSADANANGVPDECELESARLVPFEYPNIVSAINAAQNGDTIFVAPGAYYEKLSFGSKQLSMRSVGGASVTYIDGNGQNGTLLAVNGGQGASSVIDGFTFWYAQGGYALYIQNASPTVRNCRFLFNVVSDGAAFRIDHPSSAAIFDCLVESNTANNGAGLWTNTTPVFTRTTFKNNVANDDGGAVRAIDRDARFVDCDFIGNRAQGGGDHRGGAVSASNTNNLSFADCLFEDNIATSNGDHADRLGFGGACAFNDCIVSGTNPPAAFTSCVFDGNIARATGNHGGTRYAYGGAVYESNSDLRFVDCDFIGNRAETTSNGGRVSVGGAFSAAASNPVLLDCTFDGNAAASNDGGSALGGALYYEAASNGTIADCVLNGNSALRGGAFYLTGNSQPNIGFSEFTANSAADKGGAVHANSAPGFFYQCEFRQNNAPNGSAIFGEGATGPNVYGSLFCGNPGADVVGVWSSGQNTISDVCNDCNANGVDDAEDIATGTSADCDDNDVPDSCDADLDNDGVIDACDGCPTDPAKSSPGACGCGVADLDSDGDGAANCVDGCPNDAGKTSPGACGCGVSDVDTDNDGTADCNDGCPNDASKTSPGACGCGVADLDSDGDGVANCVDGCPNDASKTSPGACGCGVLDADTDNDGTADCNDGCPNDATKTSPGACGCGVADTDGDADGIADCLDNCPLNANPSQEDCDDNGVGDACTPPVDCDGNGEQDRCQIASGAPDVDGDGTLDACEADCNDNAVPDDFDIATGAATDCDGNNVLDTCDILAGALDSDGDGLLDECETDCNSNGVLDTVEISTGAAADCDSNGIIDACQDRSTAESAAAAPWGNSAALQLSRTGLPPATGTVRIRVEVIGDLDGLNEFAMLRLNGVALATMFGTTGVFCPASAQVHTHTMSAAQWNAAVPSGSAVVRVEAPTTVSATECSASFARVTVSYQNPTSDCDVDGTSDLCEIAAGTQADCDGDRVPDSCAVASGSVSDCNANGTPDSCDIAAGEADCDGDGEIDVCAVASGDVSDCNGNGTPDACDLQAPGSDCDGSGGLDSCEIASGAVSDCDANGVPDSCDLASGVADCNANGVIDSCDIASGGSEDVDANGVPDECKTDCNGNGLPDAYELAEGLVPDCDANGAPDMCDIAGGAADCNANGVPDTCDLADGSSNDVNGDGRPDECEGDCNGNGVPDAFEVANGSVPDCNANGVPDSCDLAAGASDCDANGVIDSCDVAAGAPDDNANQVPDTCDFARGDFDLDGSVGGGDLAILLSLWGLRDPPIGDFNGDGTVGGADLAVLLSFWG